MQAPLASVLYMLNVAKIGILSETTKKNQLFSLRIEIFL